MRMKNVTVVTLLLATMIVASAVYGEEKGRGIDYEIDTTTSTKALKVGERGKLVIAIVPQADRKVHKQAPLSIQLRAPAGIVLDKSKLGRGDVKHDSDKRLELEVGFTAKTLGEQAVEANAAFFICTDKWCQRMTERIVVSIQVQ